MVRVALSAFFVLAACATTSVAQVTPGTTGQGEPLPPPVAPTPGEVTPALPASPPAPPGAPPAAPPAADAGGDADFSAARRRFEEGDREGARTALESFVTNHPDHGGRRAAELMLARLALLRGDVGAAAKLLEPLAETAPEAGVSSNARYYLGLADVRLGKLARGRELLTPFLPPAGSAGPGDEALLELRGALAVATAGLGDLAASIALWDAYDRGARLYEKAYARAKASELAAEIPPEPSWRTFESSPEKGLARAMLGPKAAAYLRTQGDVSGAEKIDDETADARRALGLEELQRGPGGGDPSHVGLAVPLSGKYQPVGEAAMRAAMLATGMPAAGGQGPLQLAVRDVAFDAEHPGRGLAELAKDEAVIGALGAGDRKSAAGTIRAAEEEGVPLLSLDDVAPGAATTAFQLVHSPEARVAELARRGLATGAREFAILGPDSASGKRLRDAFRQAVTAGGGRVAAEATYPPGTTSFTSAIAAIKKVPPQAVFVADGADRLELIAPALAFADLWSAPGGKKGTSEPGKPRVRNVLLLATANDLSPRLLQTAGRYVQGALLAPGFFADAADPAAKTFVDTYRGAYGQEPHATEAYAYDGMNALRAAAASGKTRADVLRALQAGAFDGVTGTLRFGPEHARVDPPRVYTVDGDQIRLAR